jgi:hypothetical protein
MLTNENCNETKKMMFQLTFFFSEYKQQNYSDRKVYLPVYLMTEK